MYIVIDIGCIECGESSDIVGIFLGEIEALEVANYCNEHLNFMGGGQHSFEVFNVQEKMNVINKIYSEAAIEYGANVMKEVLNSSGINVTISEEPFDYGVNRYE